MHRYRAYLTFYKNIVYFHTSISSKLLHEQVASSSKATGAEGRHLTYLWLLYVNASRSCQLDKSLPLDSFLCQVCCSAGIHADAS